MKKLIFLEGLPGVGKTTLLNIMKQKKIKNFYFVDEIINSKITMDKVFSEQEFMTNEDQKINLYNHGTIIIDRGPISVLSYSQTKKIMRPEYNLLNAEIWFKKHLNILKNCKIIFLTNANTDFTLTTSNLDSPYSSIESQKVLEAITIYNIKKYCLHYKIIKYYKTNIDEVINEIIS